MRFTEPYSRDELGARRPYGTLLASPKTGMVYFVRQTGDDPSSPLIFAQHSDGRPWYPATERIPGSDDEKIAREVAKPEKEARRSPSLARKAAVGLVSVGGAYAGMAALEPPAAVAQDTKVLRDDELKAKGRLYWGPAFLDLEAGNKGYGIGGGYRDRPDMASFFWEEHREELEALDQSFRSKDMRKAWSVNAGLFPELAGTLGIDTIVYPAVHASSEYGKTDVFPSGLPDIRVETWLDTIGGSIDIEPFDGLDLRLGGEWLRLKTQLPGMPEEEEEGDREYLLGGYGSHGRVWVKLERQAFEGSSLAEKRRNYSVDGGLLVPVTIGGWDLWVAPSGGYVDERLTDESLREADGWRAGLSLFLGPKAEQGVYKNYIRFRETYPLVMAGNAADRALDMLDRELDLATGFRIGVDGRFSRVGDVEASKVGGHLLIPIGDYMLKPEAAWFRLDDDLGDVQNIYRVDLSLLSQRSSFGAFYQRDDMLNDDVVGLQIVLELDRREKGPVGRRWPEWKPLPPPPPPEPAYRPQPKPEPKPEPAPKQAEPEPQTVPNTDKPEEKKPEGNKP